MSSATLSQPRALSITLACSAPAFQSVASWANRRSPKRCLSKSSSLSLIASVTAGSLGTHSPFLAGRQRSTFALDASQQLVERRAKQRHAVGLQPAGKRLHVDAQAGC